jgi:molybdopterin-biosynthesis enzyme MoeA-like protein
MGVVLVGDELLSGRRQDRHLAHVVGVLGRRGMQVVWCRIVGDDGARLTETLGQTRLDHVPVLCFGGIGSTPDDRTRASAARAFGVDLELHRQAVALIEQQFGEQAYPHRIRMAELPRGCRLIPNPYNRIPGFSLDHHHFFPGFPEMAWPMLDWVLETYYPASDRVPVEAAVRVRDVRESDLCDLMETLAQRHDSASLFSLPHLGSDRYVELGFRGDEAVVDPAFRDLVEALGRLGMKFDPVR